MDKILLQLQLQEHKGSERIFASFPYDNTLQKIIKEIPGARYSNTHKSWHFPAVKEVVQMLANKVKDVADVDTKLLKEQWIAKKQFPALVKDHTSNPVLSDLSIVNQEALHLFIQTLVMKAYSPGTIKTYKNEFYQLLKEIKDRPVQDLTIDHII
ncbi:MAG: hypothetical protein WKG06_25435 [Segetibacter sp.]